MGFNNGFDKAIKNVIMFEDIGKRYTKIFDSMIVDIYKPARIVEDFQNNYYEKMIKPYSKLLESGIKTDYISSISGVSEVLEAVQGFPVLELSSSMKAWESSMRLMSSNFINRYNSIIIDAMKSFSTGTIEMNRNMVDFSSLQAFNINELIPELDNIGEFEFDEELENEVDWHKVENIANDMINRTINRSISKDAPLVYIINTLIGELLQYNLRNEIITSININDNLVKRIIVNIIIWLTSIICYYYFNKAIATNINNNKNMKQIKRNLKKMDIYEDVLYGGFRIVAKDELEVKYSNKMKSGVRYYLNFGQLVKIEHKNRNWTKISYTNEFTDEREMGWVLTRYIKRLD